MPTTHSALRNRTRGAQRAGWGGCATLALVAALAGCSSTEESAPGPTTSGPGPLSEYLSAVSIQVADLDSYNAQLDASMEEAIAVCMTAKGWEYTPQPYAAPDATAPLEPDNEEWVAQYGFGNAGGFADTPYAPPDSNAPYVSTLSETAEEAYWEAFTGDPTILGPESTAEDMYTHMGCIGEAARAVELEEAANPYSSPEFADLTSAIDALTGAALVEPEMVDLASQWSSCMADAGLTFASREDMNDEILALRNSLPFPHEDGAVEAVAAADEQEISTALADLTCRHEVDWDATAQRVQTELEKRFIADHKAELDELIAAAQTSGQQ